MKNCRFSCNKHVLHSLRELSRLLIRSRLMESFQREHIDVRVHPRLKSALAGKTQPCHPQ